MKKLLIFIQNGVGGAERMSVNIAKLLPQNEWEIIFCKVSFPGKIQNGRIDMFIPSHAKITNIFWGNQISFLRQLRKVISQQRPDVVFSSVMPINQRVLLLRKLFKNTRFIVRNDNYVSTLSGLKRKSLSLTYKNADKIIAQTEEMGDELVALGLNPDKVNVLHNLLDTELISKKAEEPSPFPKDGKIRYVAVGRLAHQKGYDILVDAFKIVSERLPESQLYIVGSTEYGKGVFANQIKNKIEGLGLTDKVHLLGYSDNPYRYIKNATAFVLSSRNEGLPNVLVEAQFLKTPVAAAKCIPIISRMVKDGENGYLAETENPKSLAEAMIKAVNIKEVKEIYKPSSKEDFLKVFN